MLPVRPVPRDRSTCCDARLTIGWLPGEHRWGRPGEGVVLINLPDLTRGGQAEIWGVAIGVQLLSRRQPNWLIRATQTIDVSSMGCFPSRDWLPATGTCATRCPRSYHVTSNSARWLDSALGPGGWFPIVVEHAPYDRWLASPHNRRGINCLQLTQIPYNRRVYIQASCRCLKVPIAVRERARCDSIGHVTKCTIQSASRVAGHVTANCKFLCTWASEHTCCDLFYCASSAMLGATLPHYGAHLNSTSWLTCYKFIYSF